MLLEEGELLAREARHRVANDLGVALSGLRLAQRGALSAEELSGIIGRVETAAAVHLVLCREPRDAVVDLESALGRLRGPLSDLAAGRGWAVRFEVDRVGVDERDAARIAMIVHELVANAVRHAEAARRVVEVRVSDAGALTILSVVDGGVARGWSRSGGQGAGIVDALARAMSGVVRRGEASESGGVEVLLPSLARVACADEGTRSRAATLPPSGSTWRSAVR